MGILSLDMVGNFEGTRLEHLIGPFPGDIEYIVKGIELITEYLLFIS